MNDNPLDAPRRAPEDARTIHQRLEDWRTWAQFVYLGGGPAVGTDEELRQRVCETHDQEVGHDTIQRLQQAVTQGAREQRRLEKALNESQARIADLSARLVQVEQERDDEKAAHRFTIENYRRCDEIIARLFMELTRDLGWDGKEKDSAYAYLRYRLSLPPKLRIALAAGADPALAPRSE